MVTGAALFSVGGIIQKLEAQEAVWDAPPPVFIANAVRQQGGPSSGLCIAE